MPYILCGGHTVTTNDDGTFYINVQSPNGKKADCAAYTIGPFGTGFSQAGENNHTQARETIPVGYRPADTSNVPIAVSGGNTTFILYGEANGTVTMLGNPNSAYAGCTGVWRTSDPMPAA